MELPLTPLPHAVISIRASAHVMRGLTCVASRSEAAVTATNHSALRTMRSLLFISDSTTNEIFICFFLSIHHFLLIYVTETRPFVKVGTLCSAASAKLMAG